ncbi:MAG TPA: FAD-binding protein, partial [Nitrososphaera sp.]|nr:FAD-binding protein [Nitrososphaera sp.]
MPVTDELVRVARGEVFSDTWTRTAYSVDASHYEITPLAVVHPADQEDVQNICRVCSHENQTIVARGAGTGLLGQALSDGIVLDFTKHMNQLLEIEEDYVV